MDEPDFKEKIIKSTRLFYQSSDDKLRPAVGYVWDEIGKSDFDKIVLFLEKALNDRINKVKSAIMGVLKKMGEKNFQPTLSLAKKFINHPDPEVRRLIVHGIELGSRNHPEEIYLYFISFKMK